MILVLVETEADGVTLTSREALTFARELSTRTGDAAVEAVVVGPLGNEREAVVRELGAQGVSRVHHADSDRLGSYAAAAWAAAVAEVAPASGLVVASGTPRGNEVLAHVSVRLDVVMAANVVSVSDSDPLVVARQVLGGSALEEMRLAGDIAVLSVAGHAVEPAAAASPTEPDIVAYEPELADRDLVGRVVRTEQAEGDDTSALTSARVVVGAGRGAGSADGFGDLLELVDLLDGALGVSRVVTSLGWRPHHEQVGQTGSRIAPDVYIACGISGAIQHWAGCQSAKTIVAINSDEDAPMVTRADYAIVGDLHEIVPAINDEIRRRTT
ncbi:electron transfer flavoprotein subunit alpha/FixB family protein [Solicola gregarius]|uniref:Electron transfer flavoprotein subunit alpha/FixB family protein n=1 Tax=Solicola gregarius TaxID=2908642 RepID=A0AA46YJ59_9ACTN|nr:electron transfer flavoprotein subunit alpha/FixB family protein [Solicola gregarius]UYM03927.1 electron transfer flavoprotein subunit alpha/FixB family protein [Solicola gregarius]